MSPGPGLCTLVGKCGPLGGEGEESGRRCGTGFACGVSVFVSARSGLHVFSPVGPDVRRWTLPSTKAAARISQMGVPTWCTSWSVVRRGWFRSGLRPMRRRTL